MSGAAVATSMLLAGAGAALTYWVARHVLRDGVLAWIAIAGLAGRAALSVALFWISYAGLPLATPLQLGDGFWTFAPDAQHHHVYALRILDAWRGGVELPTGLEGGWYFLFVAALYGVVGVHPLHGSMVNAAAGAFSALLAYAIARRLGGVAAARISAALMAFWPSLVLWSTQLLKEQLTILFVLLALYLTMALCDVVERARRSVVPLEPLRFVALVGAAAIMTFVIALARPLYALALGAAAMPVFAVVALAALRDRQFTIGVAAPIAGGAMLITALFTQTLNPLYWSETRTPWEGHHARGMALLDKGYWVLASREFARALELRPDYEPARAQIAALPLPIAPRADATAVNWSAPEPSAAVQRQAGWLASQGDRAWRMAINVMNFPATVSNLRMGQMQAAGSSPIDPDITFASFGDVLLYLPKGAAYFFLAPFPWQVLQPTGVSGSLKMISLLETAVLYVLIPFAVVAGWPLLRQRQLTAWVFVLYLFIGCTVLGLTMVGLGSLFRYRLSFLLVVLILGSVGIGSRWTPAAQRA